VNTQEGASHVSRQSGNGTPLLKATALMKYYKIRRGGWLGRKKADLKAVDGVSFSVNKGATWSESLPWVARQGASTATRFVNC
jgi:ABC-type glutathione transport system ATPase component